MSKVLELYDSRVSDIRRYHEAVVIHLSVGYVYQAKGRLGVAPASEWSQEANVVLEEATLSGAIPPLPQCIAYGFLEVGGVRHETIPLPFSRKGRAWLYLRFADDSEIEVHGELPHVCLIGTPVFLEDMG